VPAPHEFDFRRMMLLEAGRIETAVYGNHLHSRNETPAVPDDRFRTAMYKEERIDEIVISLHLRIRSITVAICKRRN
jgi:hypothetical protein